jgi:hypothetical protein
MEKEISKPTGVYTTTTQEIKNKDGSTKTIREREVENGFIISIEIYKPGSKGKDSQWITKEYISTKSMINSNQSLEETSMKDVLKNLGYNAE